MEEVTKQAGYVSADALEQACRLALTVTQDAVRRLGLIQPLLTDLLETEGVLPGLFRPPEDARAGLACLDREAVA